jgi:alpha-1,6-mannosyltransferase
VTSAEPTGKQGRLNWLWLIAALLAAVMIATPFAFRAYGDNAYMAFALAAGLLAMTATPLAERAPQTHALWLILGVAILLRAILLFTEPLLSTDVYRYVWDGKVQAAGVNPYRYVPANDALAHLRDIAVYPKINRADYAVTIYPPVAQMFFFLVTRLGESVVVMKLAFVACEGVTVTVIILLLRRLGRPVTRIVAYAWHPLPMWEIANNGHIDALMVMLMMAGIWLAVSGRNVSGAISVTLAALAKPFAILALPALWKPWDWKAPVAVAATIALCYAPYLSVGWGVFGFLTTGYLSEEAHTDGSATWPLAAWRWLVGRMPGDYFVYLAISALIIVTLSILAASRNPRTPQIVVTDVARLLMAFLLLLSPHYPWYFLALTPFVALIGGAPIWAVTLGALLLQEEIVWDFFIPVLTRKSALYAMLFSACAYVVWQTWRRESAAAPVRVIQPD